MSDEKTSHYVTPMYSQGSSFEYSSHGGHIVSDKFNEEASSRIIRSVSSGSNALSFSGRSSYKCPDPNAVEF